MLQYMKAIYTGIWYYLMTFLLSLLYPKVAETDAVVPFSPFQHAATMTEYVPKISAGSSLTWLLFPGRKCAHQPYSWSWVNLKHSSSYPLTHISSLSLCLTFPHCLDLKCWSITWGYTKLGWFCFWTFCDPTPIPPFPPLISSHFLFDIV